MNYAQSNWTTFYKNLKKGSIVYFYNGIINEQFKMVVLKKKNRNFKAYFLQNNHVKIKFFDFGLKNMKPIFKSNCSFKLEIIN